MKDISFYEQAGLVIPGSVLLFGCILIFPALNPLFLQPTVTVGALGLFVIAAYALGHAVAAAGNLLEATVWFVTGGMPSQWVCSVKNRLLSGDLIDRLEAKAHMRLGMQKPLRGMDRAAWRSTFGLIYRDVLSVGPNGRIETFNGNYGLNRGLAAACLIMAILAALFGPEPRLWWSTGLGAAGCVFTFRMYRFGIYFAKEVFTRFTLLPDVRA